MQAQATQEVLTGLLQHAMLFVRLSTGCADSGFVAMQAPTLWDVATQIAVGL